MTVGHETVLFGVPISLVLLALLVLRDARTVSGRRRSMALDLAVAALMLAFVAVLAIRFTALV